MQSIMEESKVIETMSILLYSRLLDNLYCQIYDLQSKQLVSKCTINTQTNSQIPIKRRLSNINILIKDNEEETIIKDQFKFGFQDFCSDTTVQQLENYIKIKKNFNGYSLLFQMYYKNESLCSLNSIACSPRPQVQAIIQKNKLQESQIREISKLNLSFLGHRVLSKKQIYLSFNEKYQSASVSNRLQNNYSKRINRTKKTLKSIINYSVNNSTKNHLKTNKFSIHQQQAIKLNNIYKQKNDQKEKRSNNGQFFFHRKDHKNFTYAQNRNFRKKKQKKITFFEYQNSQQYLKTLDDFKSSSNIEKIDDINDSKTRNSIKKLRIFPCNNQYKSSYTANKYVQQTNQDSQNSLSHLISLNNQKQAYKIGLKNSKENLTSNIILKSKQQIFNNFNKSDKIRKSNQIFYQRLYKGTLKSISRQDKILNFARRICRTELNE